MKSSQSCLLAALTALTLAGTAFAQTNAYDDAFHYNKMTWITNNLNGGFGFSPWVLETNLSNVGSHGFFTTHNVGTTPAPTIASPTNSSTTGSPPGNDNSQHVWGLFANGTGANMAVAYRGFSNSLTTNVAFKIQWQNDGIGNNATNQGGFVLRTGNPTNGVADFTTSFRFQFYYIGGGQNSFVFWDGNGPQTIGIPFTSAGLECEFTLEPNDTYRFVVKNVTNNVVLATLDGQPLNGSPGDTIDSIALFSKETSANQEFNRMQIVSTSLTPPTISNVQPTNGSIYLDATSTNVSFEVDTATSTVSGISNNVVLTLNGVAQTNLLLNTNGPTQQLLVTNNVPLQPNVLYNAVIIATDANNNQVTNTFSFNTWLPTDPFVEAEDYNFQGGMFLTNIFPDAFDAYANLLGTNGIDYNIANLAGTNNPYRLNDLPELETSGDVDHANYASGGFANYNLGFTDTGDWLDYTRVFDSGTYNVYARMAGFGTTPEMQLDHLANPTATTTNQPRAALGTFSPPSTGGPQVYTFVPLNDFFGNSVAIQFPSTNTFRTTAIGSTRSYNLDYLIFVANMNSATLRPYISAGTPAANSTGIGLDANISYTIANRQTSVNAASIQYFLDGTNITSSATISTNLAGASVSFVPSTFLTPNTTYTNKTIFTDSSGVSATNSWTFTTVNSPNVIIPATNAQPIAAAGTPGFALRLFKISDSAPTTASIANAEAELAGLLIDPNTTFPYPNLAPGPNGDGTASETNEINYDIAGDPTGTPTFPFKSPFPNIASNTVNNNIAMQALMYLQLNAGSYVFAVRSDDGFKFTTGPTPANTNLLLGEFDGGRGNGTPTIMYVTVLTNGLYPMRLLYYQAGSGGNVEFYSLNGGTPILINDPTNANAIKAFQSLAVGANPVTIVNPAYNGGTVSFSFLTQSGHTHFVEYKNNLTDASWTPLQTVPGTGSTTNITDNTASGSTRFYRVRTQ